MAKQLRSKLKNYSKRPILYNGKRLPGGVAHRMLNRGVKRAPNKTGVPVELFGGYQSHEEFLDELQNVIAWYSVPLSKVPPKNRSVRRDPPDEDREEKHATELWEPRSRLKTSSVLTKKVFDVLDTCVMPDNILYWFNHQKLANEVYEEKMEGFSIGTAAAEAFFFEFRKAVAGPYRVTDKWQRDIQCAAFFLRKCWTKHGADNPRSCCDGNHITEATVDIAMTLLRGALSNECRLARRALCADAAEKIGTSRDTTTMSILAKRKREKYAGT